jgi:hypothetical protein
MNVVVLGSEYPFCGAGEANFPFLPASKLLFMLIKTVCYKILTALTILITKKTV